jgi:hypothetical protein
LPAAWRFGGSGTGRPDRHCADFNVVTVDAREALR